MDIDQLINDLTKIKELTGAKALVISHNDEPLKLTGITCGAATLGDIPVAFMELNGELK